MNTIKAILIILLISFFTDRGLGQEIQKVIVKGSVRNLQTQLPLEGARITLQLSFGQKKPLQATVME